PGRRARMARSSSPADWDSRASAQSSHLRSEARRGRARSPSSRRFLLAAARSFDPPGDATFQAPLAKQRSIGLDVGVVDDFAPLRDLEFDTRAELIRHIGDRSETQRFQTILNIAPTARLPNVPPPLTHPVLRR